MSEHGTEFIDEETYFGSNSKLYDLQFFFSKHLFSF